MEETGTWMIQSGVSPMRSTFSSVSTSASSPCNWISRPLQNCTAFPAASQMQLDFIPCTFPAEMHRITAVQSSGFQRGEQFKR